MTYLLCINRLEKKGYIVRNRVGKYVQHNITRDGIVLLHEINTAIEQAAQDFKPNP
jgi:hypothetical protein